MTTSRRILIAVLGAAAMLIAATASSTVGAEDAQASVEGRSAAARCLTWRRRSPTKALPQARPAVVKQVTS